MLNNRYTKNNPNPVYTYHLPSHSYEPVQVLKTIAEYKYQIPESINSTKLQDTALYLNRLENQQMNQLPDTKNKESPTNYLSETPCPAH